MKHTHNDETFFDQMVESGKNHGQDGESRDHLSSDDYFAKSYRPDHVERHSQSIAEILDHFEESYQNKVMFQKFYRKVLFWGCGGIIVLFTIAILIILYFGISNVDKMELESVAAIATALISLVVSILQLVHTITKYCFPEKDDEYILQIIDSIQKSDLEWLKESRYQRGSEKGSDPSDKKES